MTTAGLTNTASEASETLPVQTVDHVPDRADEVVVLLGVSEDEAVEPLHVGVDGVQGGGLPTACRRKHSISTTVT